ncbi:SDR family NAD(P)-dependent oxidoreductase [Pseudomonas sp. L-22-4S-12]|uniref:SDR family NAD(P)-dependent oxidoreductase n=1 Tax=Pseudomonas sp. L-22-4S-12 TaxID=2610893 RepID=UPI0013229A91|nr:SDR family oxidoreductase [Pseudomonas sp. L-22-4S-12]MWV14418.1 SDR family NAD(P)-dependent oxidoreductase [Pseudomonas sp. L-22-4S-12]
MPSYALITGASSGLGLALAEALARKGRNLILVARQREALESVACELSQRFGIEALLRVCDLSEPLRLTGLIQELEQGERRIDLLVNNAGIGSAGLFVEQDWGREQQLIELNILALCRLCHAIGQHMVQQGGGQILNVASLAAFQAGPLMSNYFASKAYVLHFSEGLRSELAPYGVKVSVLCPGPVATAFFRNSQLCSQSLEQRQLLADPEQVALLAVRGLEKNRAIIIPGRRNRLLSRLLRLLPRALARYLTARSIRPLLPRSDTPTSRH